MKKIILATLGFLALAVILWQISLSPSHDKNWREENINLPEISRENNKITIRNFRDFHIDTSGTPQHIWKEQSISLDDIEGMDFVVSHFSEVEGIAHSFVTFRVKNSKNIAISMEVRLEEHQEYSPFWGFLNQFEMTYIVGSERDVIGSRIGHRDEEVFLYKTVADEKAAQEIFLRFAKEINAVAAKPVFYNTLWNNCTSVIVGVIEDQMNTNIWWSYEHLLPGYADKKAFEMDFLANPENLSFEALKEKSCISEKEINQWDTNFSLSIREESTLWYESDLATVDVKEYSYQGRNYKYYSQYPEEEVKIEGVIIYLHGAAPKHPKYAPVHPQGIITSSDHFAGNFKHLRNAVSKNNLLYIVPDYGLFEGNGKENIHALTLQLKQQYSDIPFYIIGASAGGRITFQVNQEYPDLFDGLIFVVPAISSSTIDSFDSQKKNVWIAGGTHDSVISTTTLEALSLKFNSYLEIIEGGHNKPVEEISWDQAIQYISR